MDAADGVCATAYCAGKNKVIRLREIKNGFFYEGSMVVPAPLLNLFDTTTVSDINIRLAIVLSTWHRYIFLQVYHRLAQDWFRFNNMITLQNETHISGGLHFRNKYVLLSN